MKIFITLMLVTAIAVPVFVGAQVATSTLPDPGTLPDSPLYFLKSWREGIQLFFTFGAEKKAEQYLHLAEVRLAEYEKMVEKGKEDIAGRTLEKYESQLERALAKAEELKAGGEEVADDLKMQVEETAAKHLKVLQWRLEKVPEAAKDAIERALEESKKQLEKLDEIFGREFDDFRWKDEGNDIFEEENEAAIKSASIPENEVVEGELRGYYTTRVKVGFSGLSETCDVFTVVGGSARLRGYFQYLLELGNSVNSKNENGEVVVNLDFQKINTEVKETILASTHERPVMIEVKKPVIVPMGVGPCFSFVEILGVKNDLTDVDGLDDLLDNEGLEDELNNLLEGLE